MLVHPAAGGVHADRPVDAPVGFGVSEQPGQHGVPGGVPVALSNTLLVAVPPWDIDGAARAGTLTAWVDRAGSPCPQYFSTPTYTVPGIDALAGRLPPHTHATA